MDLFNRLIWKSSSQRGPTVKVEQDIDEIGPKEEGSAQNLHRLEGKAPQDRDEETQNHDIWEGLEEGSGRETPSNARTSKAEKVKKPKRKKRKGKEIVEDKEIYPPQLDDSTFPEGNFLLDVSGEPAANGHFEGPAVEGELILKNPPATKRSRKANGIAPKRKLGRKPKATVLLDDEAADLPNAASKSRDTVKYAKPRMSVHTALESEAAASVDAETAIQDMADPDLSETPQRIRKAKKSKTQSIADESAAHRQEDVDESAARISQKSPHSHAEPDTEEANLAASSQFDRDARSINPPEPANDDDAGEEECKRLSKKALGKRKAGDEPTIRASNKKVKRRKDKTLPGKDLRAMGFVPSDGPATSNHSSTSLAEMASRLWKGTERESAESIPQSNSQTSLKTPRSSWNAINNLVEPNAGDESDRPLFFPNEEERESPEIEQVAPKSSVQKRRLPHDEAGPSNSTPSAKSRPTPAKSKVKTPKTPQVKAKGTTTPQFSKGKLSVDEISAISAAVESYRELCNMTQFQMNELIQSDAQQKVTQELWKAICDEVPTIPRRNVQNTCRRKFHNFEARGAWTEEQDEELRRAYDEHPGKWKLIGETLNRFPEDVRDRWRNYLVCGDTLKKDAWEIEEEEHLRAAVKKCVQAVREKYHFQENQGTVLDEESLIDWQKVSEFMGRTRSRLQCRNKWKKLKDREEAHVDDPVAKMPISASWRLEEAALQARLFSAEEKLILLRAIRDSGAAREGKIPWQTIKDDLNGQGKRMAWKYCFRKLKELVLGHEDMDFKDIVAHLVDVFEAAAPDEPDGFNLPIEVFEPYVNPKRKKSANPRGPHGLRRKLDSPSTPRKRTSRGRKQDQSEDSDNGVSHGATVIGRRVRDRMLKEGESQETTNSQGKSTGVDVVEEMAQSFQSIKRTPKPAGKRAIRKSKRNQALSEEKVVEDPSDDEAAILNEVIEKKMDIDQKETYTTTGGPTADDDDEASNAQEDENEDFIFAGGTNGYHTEGSPDLDTPVNGRTFKKLGFPIYSNGYPTEEGESSSSDDDDMSDIPARREQRVESPKL